MITIYSSTLLAGLATFSLVDGHGYCKTPRSRNFYANEMISKPLECSSIGCPPAEYCPHCLNRNDGVCGKTEESNYETFAWKDTSGNPMSWRSQNGLASGYEEVYVEGGAITIESYLSTHHNGHLEARVCAVTDVSSCTKPEDFAGNELIFELDLALGGHKPMPKDPTYPERGMFAGGQSGPIKEFAFKYRLPMGVYGEKVLMQWKYITANSCSPPGYAAYFTANSNIPSSYWSSGLSICTPPYPNDGLSGPEQFFNCAEITVRSVGPTVSPKPTSPETMRPTSTPTQASAGYCNWSACNLAVEGGSWCNESKSRCETGCGGRWCTNGGPSLTPPTPTPTTPPTGGAFTATTTRYWDCSGGACACSYIPTGLSEAAHCHSNAMFDAPPNNSYGAKFYGAAAISASLGGGNWMSNGCGKCWKVTGTSNVAGFSGVTTTLVLKGTNFCPNENPACAKGPHFDIAAPGFDVLQFSFANVCPAREPEEAAGFAACGNWLIGNSDVHNCNCSLFNSPTLRNGCENFFSLKWDNPTVTYEEVTCPQELAALHCNHPYANEVNMPATCSNNIFSSTPTTTKPTGQPTSQPATSTPTTRKPSTKKPTTSKPNAGTSKPTTEKPAFDTTKPSTANPITLKPSTSNPIIASTTKPGSLRPVSEEPSTSKPSTSKPTTSKPATSKPSTSKPSTSKPSTSKPSTSKPSSTKPSGVTLTSIPSTGKPSTLNLSTTAPTSPGARLCCADRSSGYQSCNPSSWCNENAGYCATCAGLYTTVPLLRNGCCSWSGVGSSCQSVDPTTNPGCHYRQSDCEGDCRGTWQFILS